MERPIANEIRIYDCLLNPEVSVILPPHRQDMLEKARKRSVDENLENGPPQKKRRQLLELDSSSEEETTNGDNQEDLNTNDFRINEDFAKRFEHNKKRDELAKLQEKYGDPTSTLVPGDQRRALEGLTGDLTSESSSDEDEDDDGELALGALDEQVQSTLEAIRNKDPRVYDANVKFYTDPDEEKAESAPAKDKEQDPMYISDYHRRNLLEGGNLQDDDEEPQTYQAQQDDLKRSIVKEMNAAIVGSDSEDDNVDGTQDKFLVRRADPASTATLATDRPLRQVPLDVKSAEMNPDAYLSNFMSTKAWVTDRDSIFQPFESDDEEEDNRAEAFEEAYNLRFEDPNASKAKLMSHARDTAARYSVRKDEINPRKKKRDIERSRRDEEKQLRSEEKARLRKLKLAELEGKVKMIKEAAGLGGEVLPEDDWTNLLDDAWDDKKWESAMERRFGEDYYNDQNMSHENGGQDAKPGKLKKPKWKDEIEIDDLVPDFDLEGAESYRAQDLTDENVEDAGPEEGSSRKTNLASAQKKKKSERVERREIEQAVDGNIAENESLAKLGKKHAGYFHYRETSPISHGLTANDILMADDSQLNQFVGLKKLASFRDPDKKRRDKKSLGKKYRLKKWRQETFGNEYGPRKTLAEKLAGQDRNLDERAHGRRGGDLSKGKTGNKPRSGERKKASSKAAI